MAKSKKKEEIMHLASEYTALVLVNGAVKFDLCSIILITLPYSEYNSESYVVIRVQILPKTR